MERINDKSNEPDRIALSLGDSGGDSGRDSGGDSDRAQATYGYPNKAAAAKPIVGWIAVGTGFLGIFVSFVFIPFSLAFSVASFFVGQGRWGIGGLVLSVLGVVTSATLVALLGLGALFAMVGMPF